MRLNYLFFALAAIPFLCNSQSKYEEEAKDFFWGSNDTYKSVTEIPEKWNNESAVIIYKNENYDFHKFGKKVTYKTSIRKRIKLLDMAAVEEFSEFAFQKRFRSNKGRYTWKSKGNNVIGVKVVKTDGTENIIDIKNDAIEVDGETKIAISNLEVGDIIDFYFYKVEPFKSTFAFGFNPVESTLGEEYPILDYKLFFETENDFFINFRSFNGAPQLKQLPTDKKNMRRYSLEASNIDKNEFARWTYPLTTVPSYKFQVYFARSGKFENRALAFLPEKEDIIKNTVSKEEVLALYDTRFKAEGKLGDVRKHFKKKSFTNNVEKVTEVYYFMRHYYLTRFVEAFYIKEANIDAYPFIHYGNNPVFIQSQKQFIRHFTAFLNREKIDFEIVVGKKRFDGTLDELLIERNVEVMIKVLAEQPLHAAFFSMHTNINEFSALLEGTDIYLLSAKGLRIDTIKKGKLGVSNYNDHEIKKEVTLNLNEDFSALNATIINNFKGFQKEDEQYERMAFNDYVHEDYAKYGTKSFTQLIKNKKKKAKVKKELEALSKKIKERQNEKFEENIKSRYGINSIENYDFNINKTGRYGLSEYFTYTETFDIKKDLIKKAGPNYIIEIGKFIGGQIEIEDDERERDVDIQMNFPRILNYKITLNLPEGYTATGLNKLTKSVENETGAFISSAKIEDKKLIINTTKIYKNNFEPKENWNKMVLFLDEAFQFTNEKILLKQI